MDMTACGNCCNKCHLFMENNGKWMLITDQMVNSHRIKQPATRPTTWIRHVGGDVWRYCKNDSNVVPDSVLSGIEIPKYCEYYAEKCIEQWNKEVCKQCG